MLAAKRTSELISRDDPELGVGVRECLALRITLAQIIGGQRFAQQFRGLPDYLVHSFRKANSRDRSALDATRRNLERDQLEIVRQQQRPVHFRQIVIFAGQPEQRDALHS